MPSNSKPQTRNRSRRFGWALAMSMIAGGLMLAWWWSRPAVKLDHEGYATAIALYRVCNLQHSEGLQFIEDKLNQPGGLDDSITPQQQTLKSIVADARAGDWHSAMVDCRTLLEHQVDR